MVTAIGLSALLLLGSSLKSALAFVAPSTTLPCMLRSRPFSKSLALHGNLRVKAKLQSREAGHTILFADRNEDGGDILSNLPSPGTIAFFGALLVFPGLFFGFVSNLLIVAVVVPALAFAGFQLWVAVTTQEAPCPQCGANVLGFSDGMQSVRCMGCGEPLVADKGASPPRWIEQTVFDADEERIDSDEFASMFSGQPPSSSPPSSSTADSPRKTSKPDNFVDVDVM